MGRSVGRATSASVRCQNPRPRSPGPAPPGTEVREQPVQSFAILRVSGPQPEPAAHDDRPVPSRKIEEVHRLHVQVWVPPDAAGGLTAAGNHIGRRIDPIYVQPVGDPRDEQPSRSAGDIQCRLGPLDEHTEELDLRTADVEVQPPPGNQTVVPGDDHRSGLVPGGHPAHRRSSPAVQWHCVPTDGHKGRTTAVSANVRGSSWFCGAHCQWRLRWRISMAYDGTARVVRRELVEALVFEVFDVELDNAAWEEMAKDQRGFVRELMEAEGIQSRASGTRRPSSRRGPRPLMFRSITASPHRSMSRR